MILNESLYFFYMMRGGGRKWFNWPLPFLFYKWSYLEWATPLPLTLTQPLTIGQRTVNKSYHQNQCLILSLVVINLGGKNKSYKLVLLSLNLQYSKYSKKIPRYLTILFFQQSKYILLCISIIGILLLFYMIVILSLRLRYSFSNLANG